MAVSASRSLRPRSEHENRSTIDGFVCLWHHDDYSPDGTTVEGFFSRIEEWCENAKRGWKDDELALDALLNFKTKYSHVATFDLQSLGIRFGGWGECHGLVIPDPLHPLRVEIKPRSTKSENHLRGFWFHAGQLAGPPPRQLSEVSSHLSKAQRKALKKALAKRRSPEPLKVSGGADIILFCWNRNGITDLLIMACKGTEADTLRHCLRRAAWDF